MSPRGGGRGVPEPATALGFVALIAVLFFFGGLWLQIRFGESGLLAAEWLLLLVPSLLFVELGGFYRMSEREMVSLLLRGVVNDSTKCWCSKCREAFKQAEGWPE